MENVRGVGPSPEFQRLQFVLGLAPDRSLYKKNPCSWKYCKDGLTQPLCYICNFVIILKKNKTPTSSHVCLQALIAEVPAIIVKCISRDEAALAVAQKVNLLPNCLEIISRSS